MTDQSRDDDFDALIAKGIELADAEQSGAEQVEVVAEQDADPDEPLAPLGGRFGLSGPAFEVDDATFAAASGAEPVPPPAVARSAEGPTSGWSLAQDREEEPTAQMDAAELQAELDAASQVPVPGDARPIVPTVASAGGADDASPTAAAESPEPVDAEQPADDPFAARMPSRRELREQAAQLEAPALDEAEPEILDEQHGDVHEPLRPPGDATEPEAPTVPDPVLANPVLANPVVANPVVANPVLPEQDQPRIGGLAAAVSARAAAKAEAERRAREGSTDEPPAAAVAAPVAPPEPSAVVNPAAPERPTASARVELTDASSDDPFALAAIERVRGWIDRPASDKQDKSAERLAGLLKDPAGLDFAIGFVDKVIRPEDPKVSARNFEVLSREIPGFLDWYLKLGITAGGGFGIVVPKLVIPVVKRAMRDMVSHLVIDASPSKLAKPLARLREDGTRVDASLLGEGVLGEEEAASRLEGTMELLRRDDVDSVSITVSAIAPQLQPWAFDETVELVVERLLPLYRLAAESTPPKPINLDMEEYRDLDLTIAVFERLLSRTELRGLEAGIVLQAYLPDALGAYRRLAAFAKQRRASGGAGIKVRLVKGANLAMERVDAAIHGWPLAVVGSKAASDASFKRVLREALLPDNAFAVRLGVASHNLFDLAYAAELARHHGTHQRVDAEMLLGMAAEHQGAVREVFPNLVLSTPVVRPDQFDAAVAYLVRRLEENAAGENFMSSMFDLADPAVFQQERDRFLESIELLRTDDAAGEPRPNRTQDRLGDLAVSVTHPTGFANEPDTDPSLPANRDWARQLVQRAGETRLGLRTLEMNRIDDWPTLERRIDRAAQAASGWAGLGAARRAEILRDAATALGVYRGRLIEIMMAETGKTIGEADPEVSEAIDFARYYAEQAIELERVEGATPRPVALTVVAPPWSFPVAIACGGVTAALATGSAVILKPAPQARRSAAVLAEALWEAGVPRDVLLLCDVEEGELSERLVAHPAVGRVILTGSTETAERFTTWRADLPLLAETSGKNAMIVTPSADFDLAVADIVRSAFLHAGQQCSAASVAILVDTVGDSERFRRQLVDAAKTLRVGSPLDARTHVGPLIEPAQGDLLRALTSLEDGEEWLLEPRRLDASGRLWSPGIRDAVLPGTYSHVTELFGPHLSLIEVDSLEEAIEVQNSTEFGLTAGIHSLDPEEVAHWLDEVEAGNLYVNRGITGAIVRRQPFGGWKRSQVGPGAKAGGPNYLATLVDWEPVHAEPKASVQLKGLDKRVAEVIEAATPALDFVEFDAVRAGAKSDQARWKAEFGVSKDVSGLGVERNVLRYRPAEVLIRVAEDGRVVDLVRLLAAAARARSTVRISTAVEVPPGVVKLARRPLPALRLLEVVEESDAEFHARLRSREALAPVERDDVLGLERPSEPVRRIRLVGTDPGVREALAGDVSVAVYDQPVTRAGRVELLPFLREQSVSITAHRFGTPDRAMLELPV
ncbi:bifunctional proline dehydrogenase/L-glutamate gamma-semialdehyde dehydrogenase [Agrococcus sp. Marseille-Q4369]|uniref:proline dehydrogenase family protein n=1 Tax=Agrococcus sp. Marseille-Q4369 TaxID=2810513 RepID=UPI0020161DA9|nr:bifunctional proline dehydrogenase/L-glutamate gamma-semialdehyde dehydrogenase [Agrococcus sp. Marseille-Q4369]